MSTSDIPGFQSRWVESGGGEGIVLYMLCRSAYAEALKVFSIYTTIGMEEVSQMPARLEDGGTRFRLSSCIC